MVVTNNHKGALKTAKVAGQISLLQRQPSWNRKTGAQCTREPGQSWKLWTAGKLTGNSGDKGGYNPSPWLSFGLEHQVEKKVCSTNQLSFPSGVPNQQERVKRSGGLSDFVKLHDSCCASVYPSCSTWPPTHVQNLYFSAPIISCHIQFAIPY